MSKEDIIKCFLNCKGEDNGFRLTLTNKDIDVIANEIERLNNIIKTKDEGIKAFTEDLCETAEELEKANSKIKMVLDYIKNAKGNDINYIASLLLGYPIEIEEKRKQLLDILGSDKE